MPNTISLLQLGMWTAGVGAVLFADFCLGVLIGRAIRGVDEDMR